MKHATYLCDMTLELELLPSHFPVVESSMRQWIQAQLPDVVRQVVRRAIELDQIRLQAPLFFPPLESSLGTLLEREGKQSERVESLGGPLDYLGLSELPIPLQSAGDVTNKKSSTNNIPRTTAQKLAPPGIEDSWELKQKSDRRTENIASTSVSPENEQRWFVDGDEGLRRPGACEVHMRRFDTEDVFHRRAVGAVRIEAPPDVVYRVLTDFDSMPEFIPNLAFVERIPLPSTFKNRTARVRMRQIFLKCQLYHCLEKEITCDFTQKDDKGEVQFRTLNSGTSGNILQGKWLVLPCDQLMNINKEYDDTLQYDGSNDMVYRTGESIPGKEYERQAYKSEASNFERATIVKFAVEGRALRHQMNKSFWQASKCSLSDSDTCIPLPEHAVFEELFSLLHSTREYIEKKFRADESFYASTSFIKMFRKAEYYYKPRLVPPEITYTSLTDDSSNSESSVIDPLHSIRSQMLALGFGSDGHMPRRSELRSLEAFALEQEVVDAGGFDSVAAQLGWTSNRRKPRGYWSDIANVRREILLFISENGLESGVMPSRPQLEKLGRFDIARALSKQGGAVEMARKIGLKAPQYPSRKKL